MRKGLNIILIDDEALINEVFEQNMKDHGALECKSYTDARDAAREIRMRNLPVDSIFLDLNGVKGKEEIFKLAQERNLEIVIVSGRLDQAELLIKKWEGIIDIRRIEKTKLYDEAEKYYQYGRYSA